MGAILAALFLEPEGPRHQGHWYNRSRNSEFEARAELILNALYGDLHRRHVHERECLERQGPGVVGSTKWNQQEVYLDYEKRTRARAASYRYLERHKEWMCGPNRYDDAALTDLVAVQHYIDLDLEDLLLPAAERRNRDAFGGLGGNVCEPFMRDAPRCRLRVDGRRFSFPARLARRGAADAAGLARLRGLFVEDLTRAVLRSLARRGPPPALLVRAVTSTMSQSGLASVERACYSSQVVVSGGEQAVRYSLQAREDGAWDVTLSVQKSRFEECIVCSQFFEDPCAVDCRPESFVSKACSIRFNVPETGSGVQADVFRLHKEMCLQSVYGSLMTGHTSGSNILGQAADGRLVKQMPGASGSEPDDEEGEEEKADQEVCGEGRDGATAKGEHSE